MTKELAAHPTPIEGMILFDIPVHGDARGWFKENWQATKMGPLGLDGFRPVQNNISYNEKVGTTRGIHAEPWDKFISVATGKVFGAWVDLREGPGFGTVFTATLTPDTAIFVPRGVGNSFQTLEPNTAYTYLVNDHWSAAAQSQYTYLNLADETVAIDWPIALDDAEMSDKDVAHPRLADVTPMAAKPVLILGGAGQLGKALAHEFDDATVLGRAELDICDTEAVEALDARQYSAIINAAAFTAVDDAESEEGRKQAWTSNAHALSVLARVAARDVVPLVHVSSDYVFDGTVEVHDEDEAFSPLGVYGQTKAAGDAVVASAPAHYIVRTSWVIGDGNNFVRTMGNLAQRGIEPKVVDDQYGRLSFTQDIAAGIAHLLRTRAPFGTYNLSNTGQTQSWFEIAQRVYELAGADRAMVSPVSTEEYFKDSIAAPRPRHSTLDLGKIESTGFIARDADESLVDYFGA